MAKACIGHNRQTQQKRWREMCCQSSCALEDLPLFLEGCHVISHGIFWFFFFFLSHLTGIWFYFETG